MAKSYKKPSPDSEKASESKSSERQGKKRSNNKRGKQGKGRPSSTSTSAVNEAAWYGASPQLVRDSASLPYSYATGTRLPMEYDQTVEATRYRKPRSVPGIMKIKLIPSIGISTSEVSPVNIASRKIYAWVRHANSGSVNYDAPDLMIYLLAMDSCYSFYSYLMRVLGFVHTYAQKNRYLNKALIEQGMNIDYEDLVDGLADSRYRLNVLASKLASLAVPNNMAYFMRHATIFQNVYLDAPTEKAQMYIFSPQYLHKFTPYELQTGGSLTAIEIDTGTPRKFSDLIDLLDSMMAPIIISEDMNIMSGDIIKAYGDSLIKIGTIPEDLTLYPIFDPSTLTQIQNTTLMGLPSKTTCDITQAVDGSLVFNPTFVVPGNKRVGAANAYLNMPIDDVTPEQTMVASRLTNIAYTAAESPSEFKLNFAGSEIATEGHIYSFGLVAGAYVPERSEVYTHVRLLDFTPAGISVTSENQQAMTLMRMLTELQQFSMHPVMRLGLKTGQDATPVYYYTSDFISLDNYTVIDEIALSRMHETALLSEFDVYGVGRA